jgi:hypothetical protein
MPSHHHDLIAKALEYADQLTDAQGWETCRRNFLCSEPATRVTILDQMRQGIGEPGVSKRKDAELLARTRELRHLHEQLRRAGR